MSAAAVLAAPLAPLEARAAVSGRSGAAGSVKWFSESRSKRRGTATRRVSGRAARARTARRLSYAVPEGSVIAVGQAAWLAALEASPEIALLTERRRSNLLAVAFRVAVGADFDDMTSMPTWEALQRDTQLSRATVARSLQLLRETGLLGLVESGTTAQYRPMALMPIYGDENRAAVYLLTIPAALFEEPSGAASAPAEGLAEAQPSPTADSRPGGVPAPSHPSTVDNFETPALLPLGEAKELPRRRASARPLRGPDQPSDASGTAQSSPAAVWPLHKIATTRRDGLRAAERLRSEVPALRGSVTRWDSEREAYVVDDGSAHRGHAGRERQPLTVRHIRSLLREFLRAGWTIADVLYALDHKPDESTHTWTSTVHSPAGWLRARLSWWLDEHGHPIASLSARKSAARQAAERAAAERRAAAAEHEAELEAGMSFADRCRQLAGETWHQLVAQLADQAGIGINRGGIHRRRTTGRLAEGAALATLAELAGGRDVDDHQLRQVLDQALAS